MEYKFHVADYIERVNGWIGYVSKVISDNDLKVVWTAGNDIAGEEVDVTVSYAIFYKQLKRIGKYDFIKEYRKIKHLPEAQQQESLSPTERIDFIKKKIDELIDRVNNLIDKEETT